MQNLITRITDFLDTTRVMEQIRQVDVTGLFTNPYFLVPFCILIGYFLYRQAFTNIALVGIFVGMWAFTDSSMMQNLIVNNELQIGKILPVAGIWLLAVAAAVYLLFMRPD